MTLTRDHAAQVMTYPVERRHIVDPRLSLNLCTKCGDLFPWRTEGCVESDRIGGELATRVPTGLGWPDAEDMRTADSIAGRFDVDEYSRIHFWHDSRPQATRRTR